MKRIVSLRYIIALTLPLLLSVVTAFAQTYPVQVSTVIIPPYSLHLSDYMNSDKLAVNVLFNDPIRFELSVKLKITIEGKNISITTKPEFNPKPIYLQSGFPERLTGADLAPYFEAANLNFQGFDRREFERKGALPEGLYRICVEVWEYNQNKKVSNAGCSAAWMVLNDPPIINYPRNGEKIKILDPQLVIFNWSPRHTGSPNAAFTTEYAFELVEVRSANQNPNNAMATSPPIFTATTHSTSIYYSIAETPLIPGQQYAFRVRAKAIAGLDELDLFKNNGYSEVFTFTYGDQCLTPDAIHLESINPTTVKASWVSLPAHTSFTLRYKENRDSAAWFEKSSMVPEYTISSLRPDTEYLIQVVGYCGIVANETVKNYTIRTKKLEEKKFACGTTPETIDVSKQTLVSSLMPGEFIESSNFKIALIEVSSTGNGTFSGRGVAYIPWFQLAGLKVEFKDIKVNEDHKVISGNVVSIKSTNSNLVWTPKTPVPTTTITDNGTNSNGGNGNSGNPGTGETGTVIVITTDHPVITLNGSGATVITDEHGNVTVVEKGQEATLVDSQGNTQIITGGSTQAGSSTGEGATTDGSTTANALPAETTDALKEALRQLREKGDFFPLPLMKERIDIRVSNLENGLAAQRTSVLTNTYVPPVSFSNPVLSISEEIITLKQEGIDNDRFKLYKAQETEYNRLKILQVFTQENQNEEQLQALAARLSINGKNMQDYMIASKANDLSKDKMAEDIAAAVLKLIDSL